MLFWIEKHGGHSAPPAAAASSFTDASAPHTDTQAAVSKSAGLLKIQGALAWISGISAVILGTIFVAKKLSTTRTARRIVSKVLANGAERFGGVPVGVSDDLLPDGALTPQPPTVPLTPETLRVRFNELPLVVSKEQPNHSHPNSARLRSDASALIVRYASLVGLHPFFYQYSRADERSNRDGSKDFYWAKDLNATPNDREPPENSVMALVDVDGYIDMNEFLLNYFKPTVLYTFQPSRVSRQSGEYAFTFDAQNQVKYSVSGGGQYTHAVWNYSVDCILIKKWFCGLAIQAATYYIDRKRVDLDHEIVLLTPVARWGWSHAWMSAWLEGNPVERLAPVLGNFTRMKIHTRDGLFTSTGTPYGYASAYIPTPDDDALAHMSANSKHDLTMPQAQAFTGGDKPSASVLVAYHRQCLGSNVTNKIPYVFPLLEAVHPYSFHPDSFDPESKVPLQPFMSPILHEAYVPVQSFANEKHAVECRIDKVKSAALPMTPFIDKTMHEFCEHLFPVPHTLCPVPFDEVWDNQQSPMQRRILDAAQGTDPNSRVSSFIKKEAYSSAKDARIISTLNGATKMHYSSYQYSIATHLKTVKWYAFGKTPADVAQHVTDICCEAKAFVVNSDLSRFDGRLSNLLRELEERILVRAFMPCYTEELLRLFRLQIGATAYTSSGVKYDTGTARLSGSPETSAFNSIVNAYMAYLTFRKTIIDGAYMNKHEAYASLGIYGGDDGLTADISPDNYVKACTAVGQCLTAERVHKGEMGVKFLARIYSPGIWYGSLTSCCDIVRQLSKFHVTTALPGDIGPTDKLVEKCRSFYLSDAHTPIIGPFVSKAIQLFGSIPESDPRLKKIGSWNGHHDIGDQYPNQPEQWMHDYAQQVLGDVDEHGFLHFLEECHELKDLLSPPLLREPPEPSISTPVVIDATLHQPAMVTPVAKPAPAASTQVAGPWKQKPKTKGSGAGGKPAPTGVKSTKRGRRGHAGG